MTASIRTCTRKISPDCYKTSDKGKFKSSICYPCNNLRRRKPSKPKNETCTKQISPKCFKTRDKGRFKGNICMKCRQLGSYRQTKAVSKTCTKIKTCSKQISPKCHKTSDKGAFKSSICRPCKYFQRRRYFTAYNALPKEKERKKVYRETHRDEISRKFKERKMSDPLFKLRNALRTRLHHALNGKSKASSTVELLGCTLKQLRERLESMFDDGMTWENYGKWHIDHITPMSKFDLSKASEQKQACNWINLQPLWAKDNFEKHDSDYMIIYQNRIPTIEELSDDLDIEFEDLDLSDEEEEKQ